MMAAVTVHMAVFDFLGGSGTDFPNLDIEVEVHAG